MSNEDEVSKIKVGRFTVGIVGLRAAVEDAVQAHFSSDEAAARHLLERLQANNSIPPTVETEYAQAFLREYKKCRGEPVENEQHQGLEVKVLGPGCPSCDKLEQVVYRVMAACNIIGSVEHIRDLSEIAAHGMVTTPALAINGEVKCVGRLPRENQLRQWLRDALDGQ